MKIKVKLWFMKEIDQRNEKRIEAYRKARKRPSKPRKGKPMRNKDKPEEPMG